jgi:hypothetical protein
MRAMYSGEGAFASESSPIATGGLAIVGESSTS